MQEIQEIGLCRSAWRHAVSNTGPKTSIYLGTKCLPVCVEVLCEEKTSSQREAGMSGINERRHVYFNCNI